MEACFEGEPGPRRGCGARWTFVLLVPILLCVTLAVQNLVSCHRLLEKMKVKIHVCENRFIVYVGVKFGVSYEGLS
jgi:hypothetical protein